MIRISSGFQHFNFLVSSNSIQFDFKIGWFEFFNDRIGWVQLEFELIYSIQIFKFGFFQIWSLRGSNKFKF